MRKIALATAMTLMCSTAFAQGTGPAPQNDTMNKPGMSNGTMDKGSMDKGSKGSMNNTTGMNKDKMKKDMSKDGSPSAMKKDGMSK
jgi:pentapeptide MXKDX repeat protein